MINEISNIIERDEERKSAKSSENVVKQPMQIYFTKMYAYVTKTHFLSSKQYYLPEISQLRLLGTNQRGSNQ